MSEVYIALSGKHGAGRSAILDECDADLASIRWWYLTGYAASMRERKAILMHRVIATRMFGEIPATVDHINGDKLDNRRANLRLATTSQQQANTPGKGRSGVRGVSWDRANQRWRAEVYKDGQRISLGYFRDIDDAIAVRSEAAKRVHGQFAVEAR